MRGISGNCALAALLLSVAWAAPHEGDHHGHSEKHAHHLHHAPGEAHSHEGEDTCHKLSPPNADFAFALYKSLNAKTAAGNNIFYSPLGIATVLSMLSLGAHGDTHSEMFTTLGYSPDMTQDQVNEAYEHLLHMLGHSQEAQQLDVGNVLALRSGFKTVEKFMNDIKHYYSGEAKSVDFATPADAVTQINSIIATKTHSKILNMLSSLDPDTAMVLINYVYFRGRRNTQAHILACTQIAS